MEAVLEVCELVYGMAPLLTCTTYGCVFACISLCSHACAYTCAAGMVKRAKAPTAYMLVYRTAHANLHYTVPVPPAARLLVEQLNASVGERRQAEEERLNRLPCMVLWAGTASDSQQGGEGQLDLILTKAQRVDEAARVILQVMG